MNRLAPLCATMGLAVVATSCVSYTGVSKSPDGALYISGATNYFVFSSPWVRRCEVDGTNLNCVELTEPPRSSASASGSAAPAPSGAPAASAAPEPPEHESAPGKKK